MTEKLKVIPVGMTAMRDPMTGELLDAVPLYVEADYERTEPLPEIDTKAILRDILPKVTAMKNGGISA